MFAKDFPRRPMRSLIAVERDLLWQPTLALERLPEKRFGGCNIPLGAEQKIHRLSLLVDSTVKICPLAFDLHNPSLTRQECPPRHRRNGSTAFLITPEHSALSSA